MLNTASIRPAPLDSVPSRAEAVGKPAVDTKKGKVWPSAEQAIQDLQSGSLVLSAGKLLGERIYGIALIDHVTLGFGICGTADTLIDAIRKRPDLKDLTVVSNNAGNGGEAGLCERVFR